MARNPIPSAANQAKLFYPNHMELWNRIKARAAVMEAEFAKRAMDKALTYLPF